jgi:3-hydroxyisobutyrate dehydrogenase
MPNTTVSPGHTAVVGLGAMGVPIAGHLAANGFDVRGWDNAQDARTAARAAGVQVATSLEEAVRTADLCLSLVGSEEAMTAVSTTAFEVMPPRSVHVILGTISPRLAETLAQLGHDHGHAVLNAPLCRAARGAVAGTSLALVSGDRAAADRAEPALRSFCSDIHYVSERPGGAQVAKSINNLMLWASVVANEEGFRLAEAYGLDAEDLRRAIITSTGDSWSLREWGHVAEWTWSKKDLRLLADMADDAHVPVPLARRLAELAVESEVLTHAPGSH